MNNNHLIKIVLLYVILTASLFACKKDNSSSTNTTTVNSGSIAYQDGVAQDAESMDVISSKVEQTSDNTINSLVASNFQLSSVKAYTGIQINVSTIDTSTFPKTIKLSYNWIDSTEGNNGKYAHITQSGIISVSIDTYLVAGRKLPWRSHIVRTDTYSGFTVATDSSSFSINGTRIVKILSASGSYSNDSLNYRAVSLDSVNSDLTISVSTANSNIGQFTRNAARTKNAFVHYSRSGKSVPLWTSANGDTIFVTGVIKGTNLLDSAYSRTITTTLTDISCTESPYILEINSGAITDKEGSQVIYITYSSSGCSTTCTAKNSVGTLLNTSRKLDRKFRKWW